MSSRTFRDVATLAVATCLVLPVVVGALQSSSPPPARTQIARFSVVNKTIVELREALEKRQITSREIVTQYLARIASYEDQLHAALAVNRRALEDADERDAERRAGRLMGPLHGIPIALKDNIHTTTMPTTGGALAFVGLVPPYEATLTTHLREAGAIILAKTTMTELANWVAGPPTPMPGNYNAIAGYGMNPYDPRRDPREETADGRPAMGTGGSSSGIGTTASLWAANVGTETSGSILSPSNQMMLVGIKPTVGRVSRYGVIPITADQDTAGPMAKSVADAAIMLGVLEGASPDPHDEATRRCTPPPGRDYTRYLRADGLKGARIGIPRRYFYDALEEPLPGQAKGGLDAGQMAAMTDAIATLKAQGAVIVDPADIPSVIDRDEGNNFLSWPTCSGASNARGSDERCSIVFKYGMKRDFNAWLATLGPAAPVTSLTELRRWNEAHRSAGAIKYNQALLDISDEIDVERDRSRYQADRARDLRLAAEHGLDEVMRRERLDGVLFPGGSGAGIAARPGYPTVIVPVALIPNSPTPPFPSEGSGGPWIGGASGAGGRAVPAGFDAKPQPYGMSFTGLACSEPRLIELAYAFEQATRRRVPPPGAP
jgi:amidase